ncbi:MAG: TMEM175 family protein [Thermoplasmatota archaeon]
MRRDRLRSLGDNVFGFAMTLLVLGVSFPVLTSAELHARLGTELLALAPRAGVFAVGFIILTNWWRTHDKTIEALRSHDIEPTLVTLHMLFFMGIAFVPFTTATLGDYPTEVFAFVFALTNNALLALLLLVLWKRGLATGDLHGPAGDDPARRIRQRLWFLLGYFALDGVVGWFAPRLALAIFVIGALSWFLPLGPGRSAWLDEFNDA